MELVMLKLASGEHLIAEVIGETSHEYQLKNHCMVFPAPDGSNAVKVLQTHNMFDNDEVVFPKASVVYYGQPQEEIREQYENAYSVILKPSTQIIVGV